VRPTSWLEISKRRIAYLGVSDIHLPIDFNFRVAILVPTDAASIASHDY